MLLVRASGKKTKDPIKSEADDRMTHLEIFTGKTTSQKISYRYTEDCYQKKQKNHHFSAPLLT
jgi:hypothetical protein